VSAEDVEPRMRGLLTGVCGLERLDGADDRAKPLARNECLDQLIARERKQIRDALAGPLKKPLDTSCKRRDDVTPPKARVTGAASGIRAGAYGGGTSARACGSRIPAGAAFGGHAASPAVAPSR
jgi:hypothetical protein